MEEYILKTKGLTKIYNKYKALDDFNINIKKGDIYALIGKNGAGKTTLIRLITGVASKTSGELELFGEGEEKKIQEFRKKVGCLIETPSLDVDKSAYGNLNINRRLKGIKEKNTIKEVLEIVGLDNTRGKKVKNYSLGMIQRLGIAKALIGNPEFLILDEPINGLDPMGIIEMRELFIKLNQEKGVTLLIAGHILKELSLIATRYGIISEGKIIDEFNTEELKERCERYIHIKVDDINRAVEVIKEKLNTTKFEVLPGNIIKLYDYLDEPGRVNVTLIGEGVIPDEIMLYAEGLESYFAKVIGRVQGE